MKITTTDTTRCLASLIVTLLLGVGLAAQAATINAWNLNANGTWSTPGNWTPAGPPNGIGSMAILTNNITASRTNTLDSNVTLGALWIGSLDSAANFVITNDVAGSALTFDNGGAGAQISQLTGNTASDRILSPIVLADNLMVTNTLSNTTARVLLLNAVISESGGPKSITKVGPGQLTLGNTGNAFSGGLIIKEGSVNGPTKVGMGPVTLGDTTGTNAASLLGSGTGTNALTVAAGSTGLKTFRNSGTAAAINWSGPITLNGDLLANAGANTLTTTLSGPIDGAGAVTVSGPTQPTNFVALTAANSFGGGVTLASGNLRVGNDSALGSGTLTITSGTLASDGGTARALANPIVVNGNFILGQTNALGFITLSGPMNLGAATRTITVNNVGADVITGVISGDPAVGLTKAGTGSLSVNGANTYPGGATITAGTLGSGNASSLGTGSAILGASSGTNTASLTGSSANITNDITVAAGGTGVRTIRNNGTAAATFSGPLILNNNLTASTAAAGSVTLSGEISGGGLLTVSRDATVSANGVTLSRSNTFAGGVLLSLGTLRMGDHHALGTGTLTISGGTTLCSNGNSHRDPTNAVVVNGNFTVGQPVAIGAGSINFYGPMDLGAATRTLTLSNTVSDTIYGVVSGTGGLIKAGGVALYLYGANTYAGDTTVSSGSLMVNNSTGSGTGSGHVTIQTGATLNVSGTVSGNVTVESLGLLRGKGGTINGAVTVNSGGSLAPGNSLTNIGALNINNTLTLAADSATLMKIDRANGTNDTIQGITALTYGGTLTVTNLGGDFIGGETYKLFTATTYNPGDFSATNLPSLGGGLSWSWNPANGTLSVLGGGIATTPTNISYAVSGTNLTLTWPGSHLGWYAQSNSVSVVAASSWFNIPGSQSVTNLDIQIQPTTPKVFYRLSKP